MYADAIKTLVVILAETRAHELTYENIKTHLIDVVQGDLAICIGVKEDYDTMNPFYQNAKYKFLYPEPSDYGSAFDEAAQEIMQGSKSDFVYTGSFDARTPIDKAYQEMVRKSYDAIFPLHKPSYLHWRAFLNIKDQFMGGIQDPFNQQIGSAGILIFYRWFLLKNLIEQDLLKEYDFFIITRSDYIYCLPHPKMELFSKHSLYIPQGQDYGGLTDRHAILPRQFVIPYLNILNNMITRGKEYYKKMEKREDWNLERLICFHLLQNNVLQHVKYFPYVMYTVRPIGGSTRWAPGFFSEPHNYYIKYPAEHALAEKHLADFIKSGISIDAFYSSRM
jgi:hypothetical protein